MISIVLEGGIVQSVITDDPAQVGRTIAVIDYDTDGALDDDDKIAQITQGGGHLADAYYGVFQVEYCPLIRLVPELVDHV